VIAQKSLSIFKDVPTATLERNLEQKRNRVGWLAINHPECGENIAKERAAITAIKDELALRRKEAMPQTSLGAAPGNGRFAF
jgi:hypothetical protein